ncbi:hypothetical protein B9Z55_029097 [Caenorhabditis nigoni]|uniref:Uncharacterized protein n=1 Tax=Caenorhabditis nigoni TaxID=1611254 RepID=A0A2G5S8U2_9PELO|nr:hypothetical protein B9Z55_029097 [Caenorhabditis nigoni]
MSFVWRTLTDEEEERLLTAMALDGVAPPPKKSPSPRTFFENALKTVASASQVPTVPNQTSEIPNFQQMLDQLGYGTPTNHGNLLNFNDMTVPQAQTAPAAQSLPSEPVLNFGLPQVPISAGIWPTNMNSLIPTLLSEHGRTECYARYDFSAKNGYFGGTRRHNVDIKYRNSTEHCEDMMDIHLNGTARPVYICYCFKDYCNFPIHIQRVCCQRTYTSTFLRRLTL